MNLFASSVPKPPKSGFHWIDGFTLQMAPEDFEVWNSGGEITRPDLPRFHGRILTPLVPPEEQRSIHRRKYPLWHEGASGRPLYDPAQERHKESALYDPMAEHTGLFRNFADLETSEEAILEFANRYGWLDRRILKQRVIPGDKEREVAEEMLTEDDYTVEYEVEGEDLEDWKGEINIMQSQLALWEMLRSDDTDSLAQTIYRSEEGVIWFDYNKLTRSPGSVDRVAISVEPSTASSDKRTPKEIRGLGWMGLKSAINNHVGSPSLTNLGLVAGEVLSMVVAVKSLSRAMWLQFALAVAGNKQYEHCIHCQGYFEIGRSAGRKGKQYCSHACKMAAYRLRRSKRS